MFGVQQEPIRIPIYKTYTHREHERVGHKNEIAAMRWKKNERNTWATGKLKKKTQTAHNAHQIEHKHVQLKKEECLKQNIESIKVLSKMYLFYDILVDSFNIFPLGFFLVFSSIARSCVSRNRN